MNTYPDFTRILNQKLTEQERSATWLAKRLDLHPGTVNRWLNQELRPATPELVARVADLLCIHKAQERQALLAAAGYAYVEGKDKTVSAPKTIAELPALLAAQPKHNLPNLPTAFVGREAELAQLTAQLAQADVRLLAIVGFGGVGKTRLALEMAQRVVDDFADGVRFVSLVGIDTTAVQNALNPLVMSLASVLSVVFLGQEEPEEQLLSYLHDKELLILFDNVEHLLSLSDFFSRLLIRCPQIKLLITSRERLRLVEEWLFPLHGLALPTATDNLTAYTQHTLAHYDALQLFAQQARRVQPTFDLNAHIDKVLHICQLVEGIPLGIELAAAWLRQMPLAQIASEIEQSSDILHSPLRNQPERHRSFRTVFEHSWALLTPEEQEVLMGLSVFRGGFHRPEAEAVTGATLQTLTGLVDKSFVRLNASGRYDIHERIRQYAAEKLREVEGREERLRERHARVYLRYFREQGKHLNWHGNAEALIAIANELDNIHFATDYAIEHFLVEDIFPIIEPYFYFCFERDQLRMGRDILMKIATMLRTHLVSIHNNSQADEAAQISLGFSLGLYAVLQARMGNAVEGHPAIQESLKILYPLEHASSRELGTILGWGYSNANFGRATFPERILGFQKAVEIFEGTHWERGCVLLVRSQLGNAVGNYAQGEKDVIEARNYIVTPLWVGYSNLFLAQYRRFEGDVISSESFYREALHNFSKTDHQQGLVRTLSELSAILLEKRDYLQAKTCLEHAYNIGRRISYGHGLGRTLLHLALLAEIENDYAGAQHYCAACLEVDKRQSSETIKTLSILGRVVLAQGKIGASVPHFIKSLKLCIEVIHEESTLETIASIARFFAKVESYDKAFALLHFVTSYPSRTHEVNDMATRFLTEIEKQALAIDRDTIRREVRSWKLDEVVTTLLDDLTALKEQNGW